MCGNGQREVGEQCDDNNLKNDDGCNEVCEIEESWTCSGGTLTTADTCTEI